MTDIPEQISIAWIEEHHSIIEKAARSLHAEHCCTLDATSDCVNEFEVCAPERGAAITALRAVWPEVEAYWRAKIADEIKRLATSECSEHASRREHPELWAELDAMHGKRSHYPDGSPGWPCEGCGGAQAADAAFHEAARIARGES